jgi:uncharacterized protein
MPDDVLEEYIVQHIAASPDPAIHFSWHGGEPTILGLDYFRNVVALQKRHCPADRTILNGMQTNGTLLDDEWCHFLAAERFAVGISLDGPEEMHNHYRLARDGRGSFAQTMRGYEALQRQRVTCEILCVVTDQNVRCPLEVYRFFKKLGAPFISFLPLVERDPSSERGTTRHSVPVEAWGEFLCAVFDEWTTYDIGRLKVQIFEEAARPAFGQGHTLCIFKEVCGGVPVVEHDGDFYSCDHFVDAEHRIGNIRRVPLAELLNSPSQLAFGRAKLDALPRYCLGCEVRAMCNGGCPKNRFIETPTGEAGLNYLCAGYRRFFNHCTPFVAQIAELWHQQHTTTPSASTAPMPRPPRRNEPCPCGSGRRFKNCCLRR